MSLTQTNTGPFHGNPSNFTGPKTLLKSQSKEQWLQDQYILDHFLVTSSLESNLDHVYRHGQQKSTFSNRSLSGKSENEPPSFSLRDNRCDLVSVIIILPPYRHNREGLVVLEAPSRP